MLNPRPIHIWIADYESGKGGIQAFIQCLIRAMGEALPGVPLVVLSRNDRAYPVLPQRFPPTRFIYSGGWPTRLRAMAFGSRLVQSVLLDRPRFILSTHVNFTPIADQINRILGVPFGAIAYGIDVWGRTEGAVPRALGSASRVLAISRFTRNQLLKDMDLVPERVGLLPCSCDFDRLQPGPKPEHLLKRFGLRPEQPVILTVTRLAGAERYKGYDQILRALPAIRTALPDVCYILAGQGPDRPRVEKLVRELGLQDSVVLAGFVPDDELAGFYNLCDVFAMPSKGEGFGIVFLEALACGKPVLAGNVDGSVDPMLDGELGVLVDPDDVTAIGKQLVQMLTGTHPLAILRHPDQLRARAIEVYGYPRFVATVKEHLRVLSLSAQDGGKL